MNIKGAIFDFDGTLIDSMFIWETIGEEYLIKRGITPESGLNKKFKEVSLLQSAEYYRANYGITDSIEKILIDLNGMLEHLYCDVVTLKQGVLKMLQQLKKDGVKMCIATANHRDIVELTLKHNGVYDYFGDIFTCTEVGFGKDNPSIYEKSLSMLNTKKSETLVFEDAVHAISTAKLAGFTVVGIYDNSSKSEQLKIQEISDYYLSSFEDWSKIYD